MSAPNKLSGKAPVQRTNPPRQRKSLRLEIGMPVYRQLMLLSRDREPLVAVVERLIRNAQPTDHLCV